MKLKVNYEFFERKRTKYTFYKNYKGIWNILINSCYIVCEKLSVRFNEVCTELTTISVKCVRCEHKTWVNNWHIKPEFCN